MDAMRGLNDLGDHSVSTYLVHVGLGGRYRYTPGMGWMRWDGRVWEREADGQATRLKSEVRDHMARWITDEAANLRPHQAQDLVRWVTQPGVDRLEKHMRTVKGAIVAAQEWDADPMILNTPTGIVDLRTGEVDDHDQAKLCTKITGADYMPGVRHEEWDLALKAVPADAVEWLQAYMGRALMGTQGRLEYLLIMFGNSGLNGKSLISTAVLKALGTYGRIVPDAVISGKEHHEEKMVLRGLRYALIEELTDGHRIDTTKIKKMLGTDAISGRHSYGQQIEFPATHTTVITTNFKPVVVETDGGSWRRMLLLPFPHKFAQDDDFKERIYCAPEHQAAVLSWLVEGATMPMPPVPASMEHATAEWRHSVDLVAEFIEECCIQDTAAMVTKGDLYEAFADYARGAGHVAPTKRKFLERFSEHPTVLSMGIVDHRGTAGSRQFLGIGLTMHPHGLRRLS